MASTSESAEETWHLLRVIRTYDNGAGDYQWGDPSICGRTDFEAPGAPGHVGDWLHLYLADCKAVRWCEDCVAGITGLDELAHIEL